MTVRLRPGLLLQLPSGNVVRLITLVGREAVCEYTLWSKPKGEIAFSQSWLARCSLVLDRGRDK